MTESSSDVFGSVRVRYLVVFWLLGVFYSPGADTILQIIGKSFTWYDWHIAYVFYAQTLFTIVVVLTSLFPIRLPIGVMFGRKPTSIEYRQGLILSLFLYALAWAAVYVLYLPLSYWLPGFVEYWFIEIPDLIFYDDGLYPIGANLLKLASICIVAPIVEEYAFRGVIFHRWAHRFGVKRAMLASSFVFAIVHPDPLGAFFFGIGMCVLYLRSQSLILPIVCHAVYNLAVWFVELGYLIVDGPDYYYTLEQFQAEWLGGLIAFVVVILWTGLYLRRPKSEVHWRLPVT